MNIGVLIAALRDRRPKAVEGRLQPGLDLKDLAPTPYDIRRGESLKPRQGNFPDLRELILATKAKEQ